MFSVRIVTTDHYMSSPIPGLDVQYADQRGSEVKRVPVVRIFGATPAGQKTCMHVHGVFPYLYVPYDGTAPWDRYLRQFASSLDKAINVAQGQGQSNVQHVYKVILVSGISMYGYHDKEQQFLKIFMYNPQMIRKAADLLLGGAVLNKPFQPHESHIPYTLQLFIDYNLYGMNMINVAAVKFRRKKGLDNDPGPIAPGDDPYSQGSGSDCRSPTSFTALLNRSGSATPSTRTWDWDNIPSDLYLDEDIERMSTCDLEVDVVAADILNRLEVTANLGANPGLAALWEDERQRRSEKGESTNITPPQSPGRVDIEPSDSETILRERLRQIIQDLQPYIDSQSDTETEDSQEDDVPLTQASSLHLHLSQDILEGSQDTMIMEEEEDEGGTGGTDAVVNIESIHRIVSHSQSFCDVRPEPEVGTSQDKSLVDILAALADDQSSPPASQEAAARILAMEEQDSLLSQTTQDPAVMGSQEGNQGQQDMAEEDEQETIEMSQRVWESQEQQGDAAGMEYDLAGMDETWTDSQLEQGLNPAADTNDDDDSDADSDIIPQFDGAVDEQPTGLPGKTSNKRLGMRGPVFNMGQQGMSPGGQYGNQGNMGTGNYSPLYRGDYSGYTGSQQMSASHRQLGAAYPPNTSVTRPEWTPMYNQGNNPQWPRGSGMYGQQQSHATGGGIGGSSQLMMAQQSMQALDSPSMGMQMSPGSSHGALKSPRSMQQLSPGGMHMDASHSPRSMKQSPAGSMVQSPGSIPQSPDSIPQSPVYMPQSVMPQQQTGLMQQNIAEMTSPTGSQQPPGMKQYSINSPTSQHRPRFPSQGGYNQYGQQQRIYGNSPAYSQHPQQRYMAESSPAYPGYPQMTGNQRSMSGMYQSQDQYGQQQYTEQRQHSPGRAPGHTGAGPQGMGMFQGRSQQMTQASQMSALDPQQNAMYADPQQQRASQMGFPRQPQASCMMTNPQVQAPSGTMMGTVSQNTSLKGAHDNFMPRRSSQSGRQMLPQSPDNSLQFPSLEGQNPMLSSLASRPQTISTATMSSSSSPTGYVVKRPGFARSSSDTLPSPVDQSNIGSFQSLDKHPLIQQTSNQMSQHSQDVHNQKASYSQMTDLSPSAQQQSPASYNMSTSNSMYQPGMSQYSHTIAQSSTSNAYTMSSSASPGQYSMGQTQSHNSPQGMTQKQPGTSPGLPDKQQDTYVGPISRFYAQKKTAMYEQISPPATPALETDTSSRGNKQTSKSVVGASPSSVASDNQISPLQKLLLEPSTPTVQKPEPNQRSVSRSSLSSVSSANSERLALKHKASPDTGLGSMSDSSKMELKTSTPEKKGTGSPFVGSNLYNMLSDNSTQDNTSTSNLQTSLTDSQQDLFADSLLNSPTNENTSNLSLFASDNSQSKPTQSRLQAMLSEPFDNNLQSQLDKQKSGNLSLDSSQQFSITNKPQGQAGRGRTDPNYASLSNLQNFVGSVRQDTDYGISFSKRDRVFSTEVPSESSFLSQLNDFNDLGPNFPDPPQQPQSAGAQPHGTYNFSNWPKYEQADLNKQVKAAPTVTAKKRGRPPTKKSLSVPGMPVTTTPTSTPTIGKRKRGRPRKNSVNVVQAPANYANMNVMSSTAQQQQQSQPQQQQQFSMCQTMGANFASSSMSNPYQTFPPGHQSFQQMLEDQGDQLPLDPNFGGPMVSDQTQGPTMSQGPPESTAQYAHINQQFHCSPQFQQGYQQNMQHQQQTLPSDNFVMQNLDFPQQTLPQLSKNYMNESNKSFMEEQNKSFIAEPIKNFINDPNKSFIAEPIKNFIDEPIKSFIAEPIKTFIEEPNKSFTDEPNKSIIAEPIKDFIDKPNNTFIDEPIETFIDEPNKDIAEPNKSFIAVGKNEDPDFASTVDMSQLYPDTSQSNEAHTFMNMDNQMSQSSISANQPNSESNCSQESQDFRTSSLQSINHQNTLVQHNDASRASAVSELMQYRQFHVRPPPKPSPAYTYKFKVPTPVYKRLKIYARRASVDSSDVDFVRMHPKDARKYSLLKIGNEIVRLKDLSADCIQQLQEDIKAGKVVEAIPAALRARTVSMSSQSDPTSMIAELLFCDSPRSEADTTYSTVPVLSSHILSDKTMNEDDDYIHEKMTENITDNVKENMMKGEVVCESGQQIKEKEEVQSGMEEQASAEQHPIAQKRQRRPSDAKDRKIKSMFKGNIASIPHLKKYRAGFSYFGKGRVGRGGGKVRQNHPVLGPDFEDDENIVLKDVSLIDASDGTLTPIKSRTPIAGRSPAHSAGPMADMEAQDKDILDSRLKSLYELDLNQSGNAQMFQDDIFAEKDDMETSEYEGSTDEESEPEADKKDCDKTENKGKDDKPGVSDKNEEIENISSDLFDSSQDEETKALKNSESQKEEVKMMVDDRNFNEFKDNAKGDCKQSECKEKIDTVEMETNNYQDVSNCDTTEKEKLVEGFNGQVTSKSVIDIPKTIQANIMEEVKSETQVNPREVEYSLKSEDCKSDVDMLNEIVKLNRSVIDSGDNHLKEEIDSVESDMNRSDSVDGSVDLSRLAGNHKDEENVDTFTEHSHLSPPERVTSPGPYGDCGKGTHSDDLISLKLISKQIVSASRSRSSSCESYSKSSRSCSRRNSLARSCDIPKPELVCRRRASSDYSESKSETNPKRKKKSSSSNSSACGSKSSRSSSVDKDYKKRRPKAKKKKKSKKRSSRADSDSDGIPGVDYIVTNRFKGYKEMKVKIEKLELDTKTKTVNVNNLVDQIHEKGTNGFHTDKLVLKDDTCQQDRKDDKQDTKPSLPKTGFSAEFEKFLAQQRSRDSNLQTTQEASSETISDRTQTSMNSTINSFLEFRVVGGNSTTNCDILSESKPVNNTLKYTEMTLDKLDLKHETISRVDKDSDKSNTINTLNKTADLSNEIGDSKIIELDGSKMMESEEKENEAVENKVAIEDSPKQEGSLGECQLSCLCSSGSVCVCDVNKDVSLSSAGIRETCSSSEDEKVTAPVRKKPKSVKTIQNNSVKKKKGSAYDRLGGRAFCGRNRRKKSKPKARSSKLMCTLSMLHDATLEKLTSQQAFNESQNLTLSPMKGKDPSDIDSPDKTPKFESPDFELYSDKTDDYRSDFTDTMYKLAYYSPTSSEPDNDSLPRPLSPDELKMSEESSDNSCYVSKNHPEKKLTLGDIMKTFCTEKNNASNSNGGPISKPNEGNKNGFKANIFEPNTLKDSSIKTAVAKEAPMTLKDIMSMSQDEVENAHGLPKLDTEVSSPPDLGPPVIESFSPCPDIIDDNSPPPHLTPKRLNSQSEDQDDSYLNKSNSPRIPDLTDSKHMPMLTPCRSPRLPLSPRQKPGPEKNLNFSDESKIKAGRSPGASSSGSINVVHSEQFSDISDESEVDEYSSNIIKPQCISNNISPQQNNSSMVESKKVLSAYENHRHLESSCTHPTNYENISPVKDPYSTDKELKLKEIREFEERMKKSDENKNNIFELLSYKQGADYLTHKPNHHLSNSLTQQSAEETISPLDFSLCELNKNKKLEYEHCNEPQDFSIQKTKHEDIESMPFLPYRMSAKPDCRIDRPNHVSYPKHSILNRTYPPLNGYSGLPEPGEICRDLRRYPHNSSTPFSSSSQHMPLTPSFSQRNIFDNFSTNFSQYDSSSYNSRSHEMDAHSGDLFDSRYTKSHSISEHSHPTFYRSFSDSFKPDYSLIRDQKINNSIMRTVENHISLKEKQRNSPIQYHNGAVPFLDYHGGSSRSQRRNKSANQNTGPSMSQHSAMNLSHSSQRPNEGGNPGHGFPERRRSLADLDTRGCHVIMPLTPPPTRESISRTSFDYGLPSVPSRQAFYGDYRDAPDKPREGGAQVLKVPSTLVKDLEEFDTSLNLTGLKNWRAMYCMNDSILSSQESTDSITNRLQKEPALKYVLTGDQSVIITPCLPPPMRSAVDKWCKGRKLYKDLKNQAIQKNQSGQVKEEKRDNKNEKDTSEKTSKDEGKDKENKHIKTEPKITRLNLFTGKREHVDEKSDTAEERESKYTKLEKDSGDKSVDTEQGMTPDKDTGMVHSTPVVLRRRSTDLFEPECTPITSSGRRGSKEAESSQATPSSERRGSQEADLSMATPRRRLSRRLSSNTEKTLRRTILTSQMKQQFSTPALQRAQTTQIEGPSLRNSFGFRISQQHAPDAKALHEYQHLIALSVEIHAETRGELRPDPEIDAVQVIFYTLFNDIPPDTGTRHQTGIFILDPLSADIQEADSSSGSQKPSSSQPGPSTAIKSRSGVKGHDKTLLEKSAVLGFKIHYVRDELELLQKFIEFIQSWDPDILVGYEIQMLSWGYLLQRASTLGVNMTQAISRIPAAKHSSHHSAAKDEYGADHMSEIHIAGRIVLNLWRLLRHEVTLNVYSFENVAFHVLHKRIPLFPFRNLTTWYKHRTHIHRWKVLEHYITRVKGNMDLIDHLDLIGRTSEFARVFGIEFYHVLSRGSQYRVESMMLRVAKPLNFVPASPSVQQRARMKAPECIALTLEPESRFYTDPVVVLDFQSLYPSIMIAYNYCFSTCLGRLEWFKNAHEGPIEFGCVSLNLPASVIQKHEKDVTISPNGVVFCTSKVKRGVLPIMVEEILKTRLMVKKAMGSYKGDRTMTRMLHARQLGLKLIANVTYGYTAANFSGRMPCIEVGDSIVRKARETLERSIKLIEETPRWGAKVVYGDTDSVFLLMKGRSKEEAFKIGQEIADTVTKMFPKPIKLKFEKVYLPCVLQTKKRYVGFMYETPDQKEPVYDAKGIETVRRDSCSAVSKMLEQSIKILFSSYDVSKVKTYVQRQFQKIMEGTVSLQDFIFAKEYRGMMGYKPGACVPALEISKKLVRQDRRSEPRTGERVPYVIVYGSPGLPLIQLVRQPLELIHDPSLRLNSTYYITKQILPPLDRFLFLLGVDVFSWYQDMPHSAGRMVAQPGTSNQGKKGTISQYFATSSCPLCEKQTKRPVCVDCMKSPQMVCVTLNTRITQWERVHNRLQKICSTCVGCPEESTYTSCISLDCPVMYRKARAAEDMNRVQGYREILDKIFK